MSLRRNMEHVIDPTRYSNFENLLQLNTFYLCFIHYAQAPPDLRCGREGGGEKVDKACGKGDQGSLMMEVLWQFIPFLDEDGMMRFTGRLQRSSLPKKTNQPILLPHDCCDGTQTSY
ncbi:hypothetical protein T05_9424 [Trichinella murrelli]|uniref:Uncharacterized protein n=1 Tax=Trichinella murrelli TaxID=144512 RepID=A0A0V0T4P2_9BILA|nr:hypothetical protein T05_9424 [Trichinella murrelli]